MIFYCPHNTEWSYIWKRLDLFLINSSDLTIIGPSYWDFWLWLSLFEKQKTPISYQWQQIKAFICGSMCFPSRTMQKKKVCSNITSRNGAMKVWKHTDASVVNFRPGAVWATFTGTNSRLSATSATAEEKLLFPRFMFNLNWSNRVGHVWLLLQNRSFSCWSVFFWFSPPLLVNWQSTVFGAFTLEKWKNKVFSVKILQHADKKTHKTLDLK